MTEYKEWEVVFDITAVKNYKVKAETFDDAVVQGKKLLIKELLMECKEAEHTGNLGFVNSCRFEQKVVRENE